MAVTVDIQEAAPETWPDAPSGLSEAAAALAPALVWGRLEGFIAHRWGERDCVFLAAGPGDWQPPLVPATVSTVEVWEGYAWTSATLNPSPLGGYELPGEGPYRITATVGAGGEPPAAVLEAYRRLAEYWAVAEDHPGASSFRTNVGPVSLDEQRAPTWRARAIHLSGAADLLRPWRMLGVN